MSTENKGIIDWSVILADLEAKKHALEQSIAGIRAAMTLGVLGGILDENMVPGFSVPNGAPPASPGLSTGGPVDLPAGALFGKSLPTAIKVYLSAARSKKTLRQSPYPDAVRNALALILLVLLAYGGMFHAQPVLDDLPRLHSLQPITSGREALWRLGTMLTGANPEGAHLLGFGIHLVNVLMVYALLLAVGAVSTAALAGAAVFAVHPVLTQAVVYATGNASALCASCYVAAILAEVFWIRTGCRRWAGGMLVAGALAVATKPEGLALPLTIIAVYMILTGKRRVALEALLAFIVLAGGYLALHPHILVPDSALRHIVQMPTPSEALEINLTTVPRYFLGRYLVPIHLSIDPDFARIPPERLDLVYCVGIWLLLLAMPWFTSIPILLRLALAWIAYSPFLIEIPALALAGFIEEHHAYIPGLGIAFLAAWAFQHWKVFTSAAILAMLVLTIDRVSIWDTRLTIWQDAAAQSIHNPRAHVEYANELVRHGQPAQAREEFRKAIAIDPGYPLAANNLAVLEFHTGHPEAARQLLKDLTVRVPAYRPGFTNLDALRIP